MARGSQNGISNNPNGRPDGAKQKLSLSIREKIIEKVTDDFDKYFEALDSLSGKDYVRCMIELFKLVIPRPLNEEEANAAQVNSELIKRLFNK